MRVSVLFLLLLPLVVRAGPLDAPANGPRRIEPTWHALVGATVHVRPGWTIEKATVVVRDGEIVSVGQEAPPAGARVWDLAGMHVHAGLIDAHVEVDAPMPDPKSAGAHWSRRVTPQRSALDGPGLSEDGARELRELGFTAAALAPKGGIFRGRASLVALSERDERPGSPRPDVRKAVAYHTVGFEMGGEGEDRFPTSLMGAIALIRQTLIDVAWQHEKFQRPPPGHVTLPSWSALLDVLAPAAPPDGPVPHIPEERRPMLLFDTADELTALRALDIAEELRLRVVLLGSGLEFRRLEALAQRKPAIVVPLSFPKKPDVSSIGAAEGTDLRDLMAWEHGPTNPRVLIASRKSLEGLALTTARIPRGKFKDRLAKAIEHGLMPDEALAMLTTGPASILGVADRLGTVEAGKIADLVVVDGPPLGEHTRVRQVFVGGRPHEILAERLRGVWSVTLEPPIPEPITLTFRDEEDLEIRSGEDTGPAKSVKIEGEHLRVLFDHEPFGEAGVMVLSGRVRGDRIEGEGERPDGKRFRWTATRTSRTPPEKKEADEDDWPRPLKPPRPRHPGYPFGPYAVRPGSTSPPGILVRAGTLWTSGPAGTLENAFLVAKGSHLVYVGTDEAAARAAAKGIEGLVEIDASDKHVTPGILDGHSHTGISHDVNESGQTVSAEVRIQDVTDPDDPNWYRQLAGGVTTVLTLHGSANPIGGQSQVQKLRWGVVEPREMHFEGAMPGIKFALGENVKQSNWGDEHKTRYPQTRMGVETLIRDRFAAAREYAAAERGVDSRRDLELEALAEVLAGKAPRPLPRLPSGRDGHALPPGRGVRFPPRHVPARARGLQDRRRAERARRRRVRLLRLVGLQGRGPGRDPLQHRAVPPGGRRHERELRLRRPRATADHRGREGHEVRRPLRGGGARARDDPPRAPASHRRADRVAGERQGRRLRDLVGSAAVHAQPLRGDLGGRDRALLDRAGPRAPRPDRRRATPPDPEGPRRAGRARRRRRRTGRRRAMARGR
jgi:imidazolonepropionase-like amidohydrolase